MFGVKGVVFPYFKQLSLKFNLNLDLFHSSFGKRLLFAIKGGVYFSFDNPLDSHSEIMNGGSKNVVIVL